MKRRALAAAFALLSTMTAAIAADVGPLPGPSPVYRPPSLQTPTPYNWSGIYLGANAGYGWVSSSGTTTWNSPFFGVTTGTSSGNATGAIAGGQIGANLQIRTLLVGVEGDYQWSNQKKTITTSCGGGCTLTGEEPSETTRCCALPTH